MEKCSPLPNSPRRRKQRDEELSPRTSESDSTPLTLDPSRRSAAPPECQHEESPLPSRPMCPMEYRTTLFDKTNRSFSILSYGELLCLIALSPLLISLGHSTQVILQHSIGCNRSPQGMICTDSLIVRSSTLPGVRLPLRDRLSWRMIQTLVMLTLIMSLTCLTWLALSLARSSLPSGSSQTLNSSTVMFVTILLATPSWLMLARYWLQHMDSKLQLPPSPSVK
uniref:Uncharacterized protein n=1 Tax=Soybean yellow mottle mosaic virus TaxID=578361 RepID=A0A7D5R441_9TOMB|nr:hypothetical protein [Soybean yellow mottle mosaic virus]